MIKYLQKEMRKTSKNQGRKMMNVNFNSLDDTQQIFTDFNKNVANNGGRNERADTLQLDDHKKFGAGGGNFDNRILEQMDISEIIGMGGDETYFNTSELIPTKSIN